MAGEVPRRPNVLCIVTDQQRADHLGCLTNGLLQTPHIDQLVRGGMRLARGYTNDPLCCPARATMFTGYRSSVHGVCNNDITLDPDIPTIGGALGAAGYRTFGSGKYHVTSRHGDSYRWATGKNLDMRPWAESRRLWSEGALRRMPADYYGLQSSVLVGGHGDYFWGDYTNYLREQAPQVMQAIDGLANHDWNSIFPSHVPAELHHSHWIVDRVIDFLKGQAAASEPFFCWCSFPDPHHPYHAPHPYHEMYNPADMPTPTRREGELDDLPPHHSRDQKSPRRREFYQRTPEVIASTLGMMSNIDANIGRLMAALDELHMRENTLIVYMSDHGDLLGDHWLQQKGPFQFDGLIRVPFFFNWPGHIAAGVNNSLTSLMDFVPTVLDYCGVSMPSEARNPQVRELPSLPGRSLRPIFEGKADKVHDRMMIEQEANARQPVRSLITQRHRLTIYPGQTYGELFDFQEDPQEFHNLWNDPSHRNIKQELTAQLLDEMLADNAFVLKDVASKRTP